MLPVAQCTCLTLDRRIPFNYRHFEDDTDPTAPYNERGFLWLDRIINIVRTGLGLTDSQVKLREGSDSI